MRGDGREAYVRHLIGSCHRPFWVPLHLEWNQKPYEYEETDTDDEGFWLSFQSSHSFVESVKISTLGVLKSSIGIDMNFVKVSTIHETCVRLASCILRLRV